MLLLCLLIANLLTLLIGLPWLIPIRALAGYHCSARRVTLYRLHSLLLRKRLQCRQLGIVRWTRCLCRLPLRRRGRLRHRRGSILCLRCRGPRRGGLKGLLKVRLLLRRLIGLLCILR